VTDDRLGNGLNRLGHEQARLIGARLGKLPVKLSRLVSSDYLRAVQTADDMSVVLELPVTRDSLIHECTPTSERADIMRGETPEAIALCEANLDAAWRKYLVPAGSNADVHEALVCHGNVIRWMVTRALGNDPKRWLRMDVANGSLTVLAVRPDGSTRLVMFSDASHIPVARQTWTGKGAGWAEPKAGMR
jgi:serine/threonine-protein phosphatase PGAM5